jgi:hypothetical protein
LFEVAGEALQDQVDDSFRFEESHFFKPLIGNFGNPEFSLPSNIQVCFLGRIATRCAP